MNLSRRGFMSGLVAAATAVAVSSAVPAPIRALARKIALPEGWLECNGQLVSKATYSALYATIGEMYGPSTETEFSLANMLPTFIFELDHRLDRVAHWVINTGADGTQPVGTVLAWSGRDFDAVARSDDGPEAHSPC